MFNQFTAIGFLSRDNELRYLPSSTAVCKNSVATNYEFKSQDGQKNTETMFMDIVLFGRQAEIFNQFTKKGAKLFIQGRIVLEKWVAQDGTNRSKHSLRVETFKFLDSKSDNQNSGYDQSGANGYNNTQSSQNSYGGNNQASNMPDQKIPEIDIDEDEIPF